MRRAATSSLPIWGPSPPRAWGRPRMRCCRASTSSRSGPSSCSSSAIASRPRFPPPRPPRWWWCSGPSSSPPRSGWRRPSPKGALVKKFLIGLLVVLVLGGIVFASLRAQGGDKGATVYAAVAEQRELAQIVKATGELQPRIKVNISAHVVGKIDKLYVQEGDVIARGKPFLHLEEQAFLAVRDQWSAQLRSAKTAVQQAEVSLADSRVKLARAQKLRSVGISTQQDLEAAQLAETSARLALDSAHEAVRQTDANLIKAQDDLTKTTIYAPLTGRVITLNAKEGEVVVSGTMNNSASVIATIADMSEILAEVDVDETEIVAVKLGQPTTLRVDALPAKEYRGKVVEVGSSGYNRANQPDVTFFKVKVLLERPDSDLRASMSVRAEIKTAAHTNAEVVP